MKAFVSIIVPIYKIKEELLRECIESLRNQTFNNINIILVDDGSPDLCGKICDEYASKDDRIKVIHQKNQGVSVARNSGIDIADSEWVTFVDPDDWIETDMVEQLNTISKGIDADIIMYDYIREYENSSKYEYLMEYSGLCDGDLLKSIRLAPFNRLIINGKVQKYTINPIWNKMYRLSFINSNKLRFIKEARKGQDRLFNMQALHCTDKIYYLNKMFYHYRNISDSITNRYNAKTIQNSEIALSVFDKWIIANKRPYEYQNAYNTRVCTRLYEYMRLYFFNKESKFSYKEAKRQIIDLISKEPYKNSLQMIDFNYLTNEEKIFIFCIKNKMIFICYILVKMRVLLREITVGKVLK